MRDRQQTAGDGTDAAPDKGSTSAPAITLPKGGGAIRGIGEKFAANPVTGTGSMSVPIATSPGRAGFGPQLSLSYDSGAGNGPFGFGWSLGLPAISRKTDKGLPQYRDAAGSDEFILSGAEDLVPALLEKEGQWLPSAFTRTVDGVLYHIDLYRPRVEGLFARIERWTRQSDGDVHWRSLSRDNITTLYGQTPESRIIDPADPARIFSWLICESYDDKGNAIIYVYAAESSVGVDLSQIHEANRDDVQRKAQRYLKRICYGNLVSRLIQPDLATMSWMFEVVFDYDEGHYEKLAPDSARPADAQHLFVRAAAAPAHPWAVRLDPFSSHRAGFEVRTYRRCRRVLMFHRFAELGAEPYLVRSTEFDYADLASSQPTTIETELAHQGSTRFASFLQSVTQSGYVRDDTQAVLDREGVKHVGYLKKSLPPLAFAYSRAIVQDEIRELDAGSLENLPGGLDGAAYQWVDLDGEGVSGILTEQGTAWFYKPNLGAGKFGPIQQVARKPSLATLSSGRQQLLDLAGDGQIDLAEFGGPTPGFYERSHAESWERFKPFVSLPNISWDDPNLRFVDLDGDGHADLLITEHEVFTWYPSLAEEGFGPARRVVQPLDEEQGPRLVFADSTQSIYLADMCGDGLTDLVRIRNGEVCYWPNQGYGRFGTRVTMDNPPCFDLPDQFSQQRIRLADIDGSGASDIIYLGRDNVCLYFNQSGNRWSAPRQLVQFPGVDNLSAVTTIDLLGNGTACLVWSSPLTNDRRRPLCYIDLMGGQKPHLLISSINNLGAETYVQYAPSTRFYLDDKAAGTPWITKLPFPVHVVERVVTYDQISRSRFVTRYAYHHGSFDGVEREFRGFGMVEQWDTETLVALTGNGALPAATNVDSASHVPPVHTRTWFHTGVYLEREQISRQFTGEYYREPGLSDSSSQALLLPDTVVPGGLTLEEEREACRALKGSMLLQEIYADDAREGASEEVIRRAGTPYTVVEQNFTIVRLQPQAGNRHAVFFTHAREAISYHYERTLVPVLNQQIVDEATADANPDVTRLPDPRVAHALTLEVDSFGNVLKSAAIGYSRRFADLRLPSQQDRDKQAQILVTYTESRVTNAIETEDDYRTSLPCETRTYELTGLILPADRSRFTLAELLTAGSGATPLDYDQPPTSGVLQKRLIEHVRMLYRPNDMGDAQNDPLVLLPLGTVESLALPGESYKLAFTPGLVSGIYGGRVSDDILELEGRYIHSEGDASWWIPASRVFLSPNSRDTAAEERAYARQHFFLPHRYRDPFHTSAVSTESVVAYDANDLLTVATRDALGNVVTAITRDDTGAVALRLDYRVLQPFWVTDPNGNRARVAFDALGMVVGTAVMGKPGEGFGDALDGFEADLTEAVILDHLQSPLAKPHAILDRASTRLVYDLSAYQRTRDSGEPQPAAVYTLARETHAADEAGQPTRVQHSFGYSDGFGREIQKKILAEPGPLLEGGPSVSPRWVGSGWTIFNNKGKPVRQYEPFFSANHGFQFAKIVGVSAILFYDPVERVVATLHPNHTYEKVVFDPWQQATYDGNDTVAARNAQTGDPRSDLDIGGYVEEYFKALPVDPAKPWQTWFAQRQAGALGAHERSAALRAEAHADTPTIAYFDALGRPFLTQAHNRVVCKDHDLDGRPDELYATRVELDIEGNQRRVFDERKLLDAANLPLGALEQRTVMQYAYDMLGNRIHQFSMEASARWMLNDVAGKPTRAWDSRAHQFRTEYDSLRRPLRSFVTGADPANPNQELLTERLIYGEQHPEAVLRNLRGRLYLHLDQAGAASSEAQDFKGNPLRATRRLAREYKQAIDWGVVNAVLPIDASAQLNPVVLEAALAPLLEAGTFASRTSYDALNRPTSATSPDGSVYRPTYNEANLLERVEVQLRGASAFTLFIANIDYDAKGQRQRIDYATQDERLISTSYTYDRETFRLTHLYTRRGIDPLTRQGVTFVDDCDNPQSPPPAMPAPEVPPPTTPCGLQNLYYTYDPVGNITHIRDDAQQTIYFRNRRVEPSAEYTYDATYRLIAATGREHLGQTGAPPPHSHDDAPRVGLAHPGDGNAMDTYIEHFVYDAVGNFTKQRHHGVGSSRGWMRSYAYAEDSLIEPTKQSNRLSSTTVGNGSPITEHYTYDAHGNMLRMDHLPLMVWDERDQLGATARQVVGNGGTPEITYYVYDAAGQRVRKVTERQAPAGQTPTRKEERIYLGGFEIFRAHSGDGSAVTLERETLHVMDVKQRIALVETRTQGNDPSPQQFIRYQLGNHLGSASLELDDQAKIISYEEYYPYGSTSYQAVSSQTETPKCYRYTGKERDEESGLYYYGARFYAAWLGRWTKSDPIGIQDSSNLYVFVKGNPLRFYDPDGAQVDTVNTLEDLVINIPAPSSTLKGQQAEAAAQMTKARELGDQEMYDFYFHRVLDLQRKIDPIGVASAAVVGAAIIGPFVTAAAAHLSIATVAPNALAIADAASTAAILGVRTGITAAAMSFVGTVGVETTADLGIAAYGALTGDPVLAGVGALDAVSGPTPLAEGAALARAGKRGGTSSQGASTKALPSGQGPRPWALASNKRRPGRGSERRNIHNKRQDLRETSLDMEIDIPGKGQYTSFANAVGVRDELVKQYALDTEILALANAGYTQKVIGQNPASGKWFSAWRNPTTRLWYEGGPSSHID